MNGDFRTGPWLVQPKLNQITGNGGESRLEPKVMQVLVCLAEHAGEVVSKDELLQTVWPDTFVTEDVLTRAISELRKAFRDDVREPRVIQTISKRGYRLLAPVEGLKRASEIDSLAVLPFANLNGHLELDYLGDGIASCLINTLIQLPQLQLPARSTVLRYLERTTDPQSLGRELKVKAVLSGAVACHDETIVVRAELVDVASGRHLWGEQYTRNWGDLLSLEEEIARQIAETLRLRLSGEQAKRLRRPTTTDGEAYRLYLKGRYVWNQRTEASLKVAIQQFEAAIAQDPDYAQAYAGLADCYSVLGCQIDYAALPPAVARPRAEAAARRALALDDSLAEAHASLASVLKSFYWNWRESEREYLRAIEINPRYATAHHWYAFLLAALGRMEEGLREAQLAHELDPFSLMISTDWAKIRYLARDHEGAIKQLRWTLDLNPNFLPARTLLGMTLALTGAREEAAAEFQRALELGGADPLPVTYLGQAIGTTEEARRRQWIERLSRLAEVRYVPACCWAALYIQSGDHELAIQYLQKGLEERSNWLVYLRVDPIFDPLRADPRFEEIARQVGLPEQGPDSRQARNEGYQAPSPVRA